ncbi:MATE family efflux transporter [Parafrigoribacterium soli]|uniref:hypothetical protein n=1 Tax=Parafrigoribacterium soli TaxID=3144663 RepID=UPI0032EF0197
MIRRVLGFATGPTARAVVARGISILTSFLLTIIVARLLGAEAAGSYFIAFTSIAVIATFGRFGADNLALKICGGDSQRVRADLTYSALVAVTASAVGIAVTLVVAALSKFSLPGLDSSWLPVVAATAIPQAFAVIAGAVLRVQGRLALGIVAELGSIPGLSILFLLLAEALGFLDLAVALLTLAAASWITALWAVPAAISSVRAIPRQPSTELTGAFVRFLRCRIPQMSSMMGTSLLFYVLSWAPLYALSFMSTLANVSYYTAAARLANLISLVPSLQVSYLAPVFAQLFWKKDLAALNALCAHATRQVGAWALLPTAALSLGALPITVVLYGRDFQGAAAPLAILTVGAFAVALLGQVNQLMLLCDLEALALILSAALLVFWVSAGAWMALQFGAVGVAWFGAAANAVYALAAARLLRTRSGIRSHFTFSRLA